MALYEVVLRQEYFGQQCINVFNYYVGEAIGVTPDALELLTLMGFIPVGTPAAFPADTIGEAITIMQSDNVNYLSAEARNLYSLTDFYEAPYDPPILGGNSGGDSMSPFVAYGLRSNRTRLDIKRGTKRFVGVMEADVQAGGELTTGSKAEVAAVAAKMSEVLAGEFAQYSPCVISRDRQVDPDTGKVSYVLYDTVEEQMAHTAFDLTWQGYQYVRSQTSRQYGRGV